MARNSDQPECFVCGYGPHEDRVGHNFWSVEDASDWFDRQPVPDFVPEAGYVRQHRPY